MSDTTTAPWNRTKAVLGCRCGCMQIRHISWSPARGWLHRFACTVCEVKTAWWGSKRQAAKMWNQECAR